MSVTTSESERVRDYS